MMDLSIPYYEDNTRISNSAIGWFMKNGPSFLHKKLEGLIPDEKGSQLEKGTMIHEYILQPEEFDKDYIMYNGPTPSSTNQEKFCKELVNTLEIEPDKALLSAYKSSYSIIGKSEATMLSEASKIANTLSGYIDTLKDGRTIISQRDLDKCEAVRQSIHSHKAASKLLNNPNWEEHHEFHINWEYCGVKCKSLLDCVKFNFAQKKCQLIDLKTTVKLWHFQDSIEQYDYLRQLCFYAQAIWWYLEFERGENPYDWDIEYYIVGIDSTYDSDVRVFKFEKYAVDSRLEDICKALKNIKWHQENNKWDHTREYYEGDGCEVLSDFV